jgi:membrane associated rhomboid family serine protease
MFRSRGENLRSVFVLLFLYIAFYFLEHQDPKKFAQLFAFDADGVLRGELWRLVTYQFTQAGHGVFHFPRPIALFFTLLLLHILGSSTEDQLGTRHFLGLFAISTVTSAGVAALLDIPLFGSYFVSPSLLFVYAGLFPRQTLYLFGAAAVPVRWLAYIAGFLLIIGARAGGMSNVAALGGGLIACAYAVALRTPVRIMEMPEGEEDEGERLTDTTAIRNASRFVAIKRSLANSAHADIDRLIAQCDRDTIRGVNICPPADYKPENLDGYCIRCEGFAECSARYLRINRPAAPPPADAVAVPVATA